MRFKDPSLVAELAQTPVEMQVIAEFFDQESLRQCGFDALVTRVLENICGDSGVHEAKRGVDFRDEYDGGFTYTDVQAAALAAAVNARFPRNDDKLTCIFHSFEGGPRHAHLQVRAAGGTTDLGSDRYTQPVQPQAA